MHYIAAADLQHALAGIGIQHPAKHTALRYDRSRIEEATGVLAKAYSVELIAVHEPAKQLPSQKQRRYPVRYATVVHAGNLDAN